MKHLITCILVSGATLLWATTVAAGDISFYMWNQELSGSLSGQGDDPENPGATVRVEATIEKDTNNERGFRLVTKFLGLPTEFSYSTLSNSTSVNSDVNFSFGDYEFDFDQPMDFIQDATIYEFFPRIPIFSNDKIGINVLFGIKYMDLKAEVSGTVNGALETEGIDEGVPIPQIGVRCFIGSLKKGFRVELMVKYFDIDVDVASVEALDAEVVAYYKTAGKIDLFVGWRMMDQTIIIDADENNEAGLSIKNSGIMYGGRFRF